MNIARSTVIAVTFAAALTVPTVANAGPGADPGPAVASSSQPPDQPEPPTTEAPTTTAAAPTDAPPTEPAPPPSTDPTSVEVPPEPSPPASEPSTPEATDASGSDAEEPDVTTTVAEPSSTTSTPPATAQLVQVFPLSVGGTVSDGVPAAGAGHIENGGDQDVYTFGAPAGTELLLDVLTGSNTTFRWRLVAASGSTVFDGIYGDRLLVAEAGEYTLTVSGVGAASTGTYSFRLLGVPPAEPFGIAIGDTVAPGAPGPGAGDIEVPGARDVYTFAAAAGQVVVFDHLDGRNTAIRWTLVAPGGAGLFDTFIGDRQQTLPADGDYTLSVSGLNADSTGTYSFSLTVEAPQEFAIGVGDTVSDGAPGPGAGVLESAGAVDRYRFDGLAGQDLILDHLAGTFGVFGWTLTAPDGTALFDTILSDRRLVLPTDGEYLLSVHGLSPTSTGAYSFQLLAVVGPPQQFEIADGDTVSDGVPAPGAGNIEGPGAFDVYRFTGTFGDQAVLDHLGGSNDPGLRWTLTAPDGSVVFGNVRTADRHATLPADGVYALTVAGADPGQTGTYSFRLTITTTQEFTVAIGDTVSDGVPAPGAGNLEQAGARDVYTFGATAGQSVALERLTFDVANVQWILRAPDGTLLLSGFVSVDEVVLPTTGTYSLSVAATAFSTGTYSFRIVGLAPGSQFHLVYGDTVSDGVPAAGAGNIEENLGRDVYTFDGTTGDVVVIDFVSAESATLGIEMLGPGGGLYFSGGFGDDHKVTLEESGIYTITVDSRDPQTYSFRLLLGAPPQHFAIAIGDTVSDGQPAPGAGNIETIGSADIYTFTGTAGRLIGLDVLAGEDFDWSLVGPDGGEVPLVLALRRTGTPRSELLIGQLRDVDVILPSDGEYTLTVDASGGTLTGTYSFALLDRTSPPDTTTTTTSTEPPTSTTSTTSTTTSTSTTSTTEPPTTSTSTSTSTTSTSEPPTTSTSTTSTTSTTTSTSTTSTTEPATTSTSTTSTTDPATTSTTEVPGPTTTDSVPPSTIEVEVRAVPRCIGNQGLDLLLVIIEGSTAVDVRRIDASTVRLERMMPLSLFGHPLTLQLDVDGDRDRDLVVVIDGERGGVPSGATAVTITAALRDGTTVSGTADICVRS
ncbi:hypothetical protein [Desertimonas flava]|uniref:hypothetical protein n=1 Tax=Desertimonas flava TaxID=2064846 RepID=UPI0013C40AFD|nr:hypothetical protein [Desertimonas flava]